MIQINSTIREKIRLVLVFLIMCVAFSIPFGGKYGQNFILLTLIIWLFFIKVEDIKALFKNKIIILLFMLVASHYITLFWSDNIDNGLHIIGKMWRYIFLPIIMYITILNKSDIKYILFAFIFGMFINEIISYLIYFNVYQTEFSKLNGYPVGFINHTYYSILVSFCAILILYQSRNMSNIYLKTLYTIFFITMTLNLVISGGRTGYVTYFASLIILLFTYYKFSLKNLFQVLLFPIVIFYFGYTNNDSVQSRFNASAKALQQMSNETNYNSSLGVRVAFYPLSLDILSQENNSFFYGVGVGDIKSELDKSIKRTKILNNTQPHLHNTYLTTYLNAGLLGLFLLLTFFYFIFKLKVRNTEFKFIQYLFLLTFIISGLAANLLLTKITMIYFSVFISIILTANIKVIKDGKKIYS